VQIDEQEVVRALRQKEEGTTPAVSLQYDLYQVIFVIPDKSAQSYRAKQRGAAKSLRSRFRDCGTDLASLRGQRDIVVKRIGIRNEADMRTEQREMLSKTDIGRLTEAREEQNGIEMIAVCDKKELQSDATARSIVEEELRDKETQLLERRYLRELRRNAVIIKK